MSGARDFHSGEKFAQGYMNNFPRGLLAAIWALPIFFISLVIFPYFFSGDQEFYRKFYEGVSILPFNEAFDFYKASLGTSEPGYFLLVYMISPMISKDLLFSILNFILFQQIYSWLLRHDVSRLLFPVLYVNFYLLVLAFSAERLKLALLLFLIGCSAGGVLRFLFLTASIFAHVQVLILLFCTQTRKIITVLESLIQGRAGAGFLSLGFLTIGISIVLFVMREHIESKLGAYYGMWGGPQSMLKPLVFTFLAVIYAEDSKVEALVASLPLVVCAYFIGDERIVIFSYFVFVFYGLQANRGLNLGVVLTSLYFSYKGVYFLINIILFGNGFFVPSDPAV